MPEQAPRRDRMVRVVGFIGAGGMLAWLLISSAHHQQVSVQLFSLLNTPDQLPVSLPFLPLEWSVARRRCRLFRNKIKFELEGYIVVVPCEWQRLRGSSRFCCYLIEWVSVSVSVSVSGSLVCLCVSVWVSVSVSVCVSVCLCVCVVPFETISDPLPPSCSHDRGTVGDRSGKVWNRGPVPAHPRRSHPYRS